MDHHFKPVGFAAAEFTYAQPNGESVSAPLEFWVAAILTVLSDAQRAVVLDRVERIRANHLEVFGTDGFPLHISSLKGG